MKYVGSKARIAKDILPIILKDIKKDQYYVEPFVGGANLIDKVNHNLRIGADTNKYIIALFRALQNGWEPPMTLTEEEYYHIKYNQASYNDELVAFAAICCSFAGKWWGGYAKGYNAKGVSRNYAKEQATHLNKQKTLFKTVKFIYSSYEKLEIPEKSIIYCDPPYRNSTGYSHKIDYDHFYNWCRQQKENRHTIFISEYTMPSDFKCLWQKQQISSLDLNTGSKLAIEKLFTL